MLKKTVAFGNKSEISRQSFCVFERNYGLSNLCDFVNRMKNL